MCGSSKLCEQNGWMKIMLNTKRLQEELLRNDMQQVDLAEMVGVTQVSMSRYFTGQRTPKRPILVKMATALGVTPEYLTGQETREHPDISFARARILIREYGKQWNIGQIRELMNALLTAATERR